MRARTPLSLILSLICAINVYAQASGEANGFALHRNLMPVPASLRFNPGQLPVNKSFSVAVRGQMDARYRPG